MGLIFWVVDLGKGSPQEIGHGHPCTTLLSRGSTRVESLIEQGQRRGGVRLKATVS